MPSRVVRDGLLASDAVNSLSPVAEVFFVRLMLTVDDYGRHDARASILRAKMYPLKLDAVSDADVEGWLAECAAAGLVVTYHAEGKRYLAVPKFDQRMRAKHSKCPPPPDAGQAHVGHLPVTCPTHDGQMSDIRRPESESESESEEPPSEVCTEPEEPARVPATVADSPSAKPEEPARAAKPSTPPVMTFPCSGTGAKEWPLPAGKVAEWAEAYPAVDTLPGLRRARQWLLDNPKKKKTYGGMAAFLGRWLAREQNDITRGLDRRHAAGVPPPRPRSAADCQDLPPRTHR